MLQLKEITLQEYPTSLLKKNWSQRPCGHTDKPNLEIFFDQVREFEVKADDVWLVTLPKCGTTWMQELLWLVVNDFDFETAKNIDLELRSPFFELESNFAEDEKNIFKRINELQSPRVIKSHFCLPLLPPQLWTKKPKTIYVFRNPKDAWLSLYHHSQYTDDANLNASLEEYVDKLFDSRLPLDPPIDHAAEFYALRDEPWIYYTSYERMKTNLSDVIADICKFLNKPISEQQMEQMLKHLSFEEMKKNTKTNHYWEFEKLTKLRNIPFKKPNFVREGKVGGHKEAFSKTVNEKLDQYLETELAKVNYTLDELLLINKQ